MRKSITINLNLKNTILFCFHFCYFISVNGYANSSYTSSYSSASASSYSNLSSSQNARTQFNNYSSLVEKALGNSCLGIIDIADSLPCNPATVPLLEKSELSAVALVSNGYESVKNTKALMSGTLNQEIIDSLFKDTSQVQIEANASLQFKSPKLTGRYIPMSLRGLTVVRNIANPEIQIQAIQESGFKFQWGYGVNQDLSLGVQTQFLERKYINKQFLMLDLATPQGKSLLVPQKQSLMLIEPGVYYSINSITYKPTFSFLIANTGQISERDPSLNLPPELQAGMSLTPPIGWGKLTLNIDYKSLYQNSKKSSLDKFNLGALYEFGAMNLATGLNTQGTSLGVFYFIEKINAGILYSTSKINLEQTDFYSQTVYVQIGWQI